MCSRNTEEVGWSFMCAETENETKKKVQSSLQKKQPCENVNPSNKSEIHSGEQIQYSARKPVKNELHFTPEQHKILDRAPTVSSLSSDIDEELPYDYEDSLDQPEEQTKAKLQKEYSDCEKSITDNVTFNVQNSRRSEGALNNNHEICDESRRTKSYTIKSQAYEADSASVVSGNLKESVQVVNIDMKRGEESPSCDDSLSEIEDKSEPFSLQSEGLMCSDEERDVLGEEKSDFSLVYAEKFIVVPRSFPYSYQNEPKVNSGGHSHESPESNLSEILSPVDEVLTYGSAELPSVKGGGGSGQLSNSLPPPPPAFEIITWTSEANPLAPQDFVEDTSINSENIPPLPVDLCLSKKDFRSLREVEDDTDAIFEDKRKTVPPVLTTETDQEDDGSEYTSSLPVDESNESHDPLSSFCIGDKVLVCSSRPGVLKYKGHVAFAGGFWAGVALDKPNGNHNGTFRAVKYFTCEKNHGVLVRAEDISHLHKEHCSDLDTGADEDTFSDKDPPSDQNGKYMNKPFENNQGRHEDGPGHNFSGSNQMFTQELYENDAPKDNTSAGFSRSNIFDPTSPLKVDHKLVHCNGKKNDLADSGAPTERLTGEILADALKNDFKKKEPGSFMTHKPCLMDQWQQGYSVTSPQIQIKPHEHSIVYRLVDLTVEMLCGQENKGALDACDAPKYLVDDKGRNTYRKVLFHLASDILHEICEMKGIFQKTVDKSVMSVLQTSHISVDMLKAAVRREIQKVLNLERTDQQMTEMLQTLCKYWNAKRDRVDHILIQELYSEEKQWVDYSADQITVKFQLAEEIFTLLLDDTMSVLNLINIAGNK
ncbi:uncharacterized protein LOC134335465 [Trichomycterus rosablanca]|uniref:uncharacterized protein LOC134335465 n=1 Tax=Trichomycterus rosablanca TaxID=2290929 RepID=UPI002F35A732